MTTIIPTSLDRVRTAARQFEVFQRITVDEPWMRCQHGKLLVCVQAHWSDDAPFTVTTIAGQPLPNHTQWYPRWVHADGSDSDSFEYNTVDKCHACGALNTLTVVQEAYGDRTTCSACGNVSWYSIGD
jgi:hypothetical protein